ncbi:MAG: hypothetical protein NC337_03290 [Roseburia sp.]|nr:hypothetical protein [Roseburia sp.]
MDEERKKGKRFVIILFLACICIALVCFGIFAWILLMSRSGEPVSERTVTGSKIIVMIGIFFLVLAFGYLLPILISAGKRKSENASAGGHNRPDIFDEANMRRTMGKYIPEGETLLAGVHAVSNETKITGLYGKCTRMESRLIPNESGGVISLNKKKYSSYDVYLGITQSFLIIAECGPNSYLYQVEEVSGADAAQVQEVSSEILLTDIGTCFPLTDIQSCTVKNAWMGSVKCNIEMRNGSSFKLMIPKLGGLGGGMPHHGEYREAILARLSA